MSCRSTATCRREAELDDLYEIVMSTICRVDEPETDAHES